MDDLDVLYHYCSLPTFLSIIKNKSIWLSDIEKSNDFLELIAMRKLFIEQADEEIGKKIIESNRNYDMERSLQLIELKENTHNKIQKIVSKHFVFCLSESKDLLSQWRAYADDGKGISIGFRKTFFEKIYSLNFTKRSSSPISFLFDQVFYNESEAIDLIMNDTNFNKFSSFSNLEEEKQSIQLAMAQVANEAPFYKKSAFAEENEWRIVISYSLCHLTPPKFSLYSNDLFKFKEIEYSISRGRMVPHLEIEIPNIKDAIAEVIIGPKCEENVWEIREFLLCMGILKDRNDDSIEIIKSKASYR